MSENLKLQHCKCCLIPLGLNVPTPIPPGVYKVQTDWSKLCEKCDELARNRTKIESRERKTAIVWVVEIDPFYKESDVKRGFRSYVSVWSKFELSDTMPTGNEEWRHVWTPAEISWSSIGAVKPNEAYDFAEAIRIASQHGAIMDSEHGIVKK